MSSPIDVLRRIVREHRGREPGGEDALAQVDDFIRHVANGLHTPPDTDDDKTDGVTVHAWAPGAPMGCPVCVALDQLKADG